MNGATAWDMLEQTASDWSEDRASRLAAALAFYTLLSLAPLMVIAVSAAGLVFGAEAARGQIAGQISGLVGPDGGKVIEQIIAHADRPAAGIVGTIVGVAVLFTLGKFAIGLYLGHSTVGSAYGAAGSVVVVAVWVFYSAQLLFLGAEFTQVHAQHRGKRIEPSDNAVPVTPEARA